MSWRLEMFASWPSRPSSKAGRSPYSISRPSGPFTGCPSGPLTILACDASVSWSPPYALRSFSSGETSPRNSSRAFFMWSTTAWWWPVPASNQRPRAMPESGPPTAESASQRERPAILLSLLASAATHSAR